MKHALILIIVGIALYGFTQLMDKDEASQARKVITRHAIRILAIIIFVLGLLAIAYHLQSSPILN